MIISIISSVVLKSFWPRTVNTFHRGRHVCSRGFVFKAKHSWVYSEINSIKRITNFTVTHRHLNCDVLLFVLFCLNTDPIKRPIASSTLLSLLFTLSQFAEYVNAGVFTLNSSALWHKWRHLRLQLNQLLLCLCETAPQLLCLPFRCIGDIWGETHHTFVLFNRQSAETVWIDSI